MQGDNERNGRNHLTDISLLSWHVGRVQEGRRHKQVTDFLMARPRLRARDRPRQEYGPPRCF